MTSQLVIQDIRGAHNTNPDTIGRIIKGASWKKQRIIVIIPVDIMMPAKVALSIWNLIFPPNQPVIKILAQGMEVGEAYSTAIAQILSHPDLKDFEYILTVEHDNMPPQDGVIKLIEQLEAHPEYDCISGLYFTKGEGGVAQIWGDVNDPIPNYRPQLPQPGKLVECHGTGMGFAMWRLSMFKDEKLRIPWFRTTAGREGTGTQDLYFWGDARKFGHRCAVDCSILVGHYDHVTDMVW